MGNDLQYGYNVRMSKKNKRRFGGAAAVGGFNFQHAVAAWAACSVLAERADSPRWGLPPDVYFRAVRCETDHFVDDLLIETSDDGLIFLQITTSLSRSQDKDSKLATSIAQCVDQYTTHSRSSAGSQARPMDSRSDRLVIATDESAPNWLRSEWPQLLGRFLQTTTYSTLPDAANTAEDRTTVTIIESHINRAWVETTGTVPTHDERRGFLSTLRFDFFELGADGRDRRAAMNLLRQSVLSDPTAAEALFTLLMQRCAEFANSRTGGTRLDLVKFLERQPEPIRVRGPLSFEDDFAKLRDVSQQSLNQLYSLSTIRSPGDDHAIKIQRAAASVLKNAMRASNQGCLIVGEPGAGKSGVVYDFVDQLVKARRDVIYLSADRIASSTEHELRHEWSLGYLPIEIIENWPGEGPAFVVIDALDTARSDASARFLRDLIGRVIALKSRWTVVASIRKFDLRYGQALQELFRGTPISTTFADTEFASVRHLNVAALDDDELEQVAKQSPELEKLLAVARRSAHNALLVLLRNPFNLRIAASLLEDNDSIDELSAIRSQVELLDRYWQERVIATDDGAHARELLCNLLCSRMAATSSLQASASDIPANESAALNQLKKSGVIIEWQAHSDAKPDRSTLAFAHNVLFDYACSRTLLRVPSSDVIEQIKAQRRLVLSLQPSFVFHFQHLWNEDRARKRFWATALDLQTKEVPGIAQLIGPSVCAENATTADDLAELLNALCSQETARKHAAEKGIQHLTGALLASYAACDLVGNSAGPWCGFLRDVSRTLTSNTVSAVRVLTSVLADVATVMVGGQMSSVNEAACNLFYYTNADSTLRQQIHPAAVEALCRTIAANIVASSKCVRLLISKESIEKGHLEGVNFLTYEIDSIFKSAPTLASEVYAAIFTAHEPPDRKVSMGNSKLFGLTSTVSQDFRGIKYQLGEKFAAFLIAAPIIAVETLCEVIEAYILHDRHYARRQEVTRFRVGSHECSFIPDYSYSWDSTDLCQYDPPVKMLDAFDSYLESLTSQDAAQERFVTILDVLLRRNKSAVLWRRLLRFGTAHPKPFGEILVPLATADVVQLNLDTRAQAGELLRVVVPKLSVDMREPVEMSIMALPKSKAARREEEGEQARDQLLGCLSRDILVTIAAQDRWNQLAEMSDSPANRTGMESFITERDGTDDDRLDDLEERGIPARAPANRYLRLQWQPIERFCQSFTNNVPNEDDVNQIWTQLLALDDAITNANDSEVHRVIRDEAICHLVAGCSCLGKNDGILADQSRTAFLTRCLVSASTHELPLFDEQQDRQYSRLQYWGSPRIEAANGLMTLGRKGALLDADVVASIRRLSQDQVKPVRHTIVFRLPSIYKSNADLFWELAESFAARETCNLILDDLIHVMSRLPLKHLDRAERLTEQVFAKLPASQKDDEARQNCIYFFLHKYVDHNHARCGELLNEVINDPSTNYGEMGRLVGSLGTPLKFGQMTPFTNNETVINERAWDIVNHLVRAVVSDWNRVSAIVRESSHASNYEAVDEDTRNLHAALYRILDFISNDIYFASGAYDESESRRKNESYDFLVDGRRHFLTKAEPVVFPAHWDPKLRIPRGQVVAAASIVSPKY